MSARDFALSWVDSTPLPNWRTKLIRKIVLPPSDPRDIALAEQIWFGVVKNLLWLQHLMVHHSGRPLGKIDPLAQKVLAVGLYQLRFLTRVPASAAVNEAVEQMVRFGQPHARGFVNAVLRKATREADPPTEDPTIRLSHPRELIDRLGALLSCEDVIRFCEHDNREAPTLIRLIEAKRLEDLAAPGVELSSHEQPGMVVVRNAKQVTIADWSRRGLAQVQDATAARVIDECEIMAGQTVLDRCCGYGTKTLQLAAKVGGDGRVIAVDPNRDRLAALKYLVSQRGLANVTAFNVSWMRQAESAPRTFDRVLVDVPCSNSGVLARRPEARYRQDAQTLASLEKLQRDILLDTADFVGSNGLLIYSTCSIWPEENEQMTRWFLEQHPQFTLLRERATMPSLEPDPARYHDGGYFAVFARK